MAAFNAVISCLTTDVSSWISTAGSSNIDVRFATTSQTNHARMSKKIDTAQVIIFQTLNENNRSKLHKYYRQRGQAVTTPMPLLEIQYFLSNFKERVESNEINHYQSSSKPSVKSQN
jgi:hypothetical protein